MNEHNALSNKLRESYQNLFCQQWPTLVGAILIGILSILVVAWSRPWGIVGGIRNWADWLFYGIGVFSKKPTSAFLHSSSVMDMGLVMGAFASALMAKEFALRIPPKIEIIKGILGGMLMGIGSSLAIGCNVGAFYTPLVNLSASAFSMMVGLIIGAYIGLRCILWELERFPSETTGFIATKKEQKGFDWKASQPWLGMLIFISLVGWAYFYSSFAYTHLGGVLLFGAAFGVVLQRCRFCFVRAFRDPFMTGEADMVGAVVISILIGSVGIAILKWNGFRNESLYVVSAFWHGGLIGGIIFGIGMVIAGGCGSGTLWRVAEGQLKLWVALFTFAASNSLMTAMLRHFGWRSKLGTAIFLPDFFGWVGSLILIFSVLFVWYMILLWNEDTNKFTII